MKFKILFALLLCSSISGASDYQRQTLENAHGSFRAATNSAMYAEAAQHYEYLVKEEHIHNGQLFYTLGNAYFLAGDIGRSILNYRKAELYLPNDTDVQYNLAAALKQRIDLIPEKEVHPLAARLLGWHFNSSSALRWWFFSISWIIAWGAWNWKRRTNKRESRITLLIAGICSAVLATSLCTEIMSARNTKCGVLVSSEVLARKGDGEVYAPAFLDPLHSGTEFEQIENRGLWWKIRLSDGQECWIPATAAELLTP